jgi:hypothetical protein
MKITINHLTGIITLPPDVATLTDLTDDGRFHYVLRYNVDVSKAVRERAFVVKIHVTESPPDSKDVVGFSRLNSSQLVSSLLTRQANRVEVNRSFAKNYIATITSDITAKIPNDKAKDLAVSLLKKRHQNYDNPALTQTNFLFETTRFQLVRASDLTRQNVSQPTLQTPLFQPPAAMVSPALPPQENGFNLLMRYGVDPAVVGTRTNAYADTAAVQAGVVQRPKGIAREVLTGPVAGPVRASFGLLSTVLGDQKGRPSDQQGLSNNDYTHVSVKEQTNIITVEEDLYLNVSDVGDQFYLIFTLQDLEGVEAETVTTVVHHSRNLSIFTLPSIPPFISVTPKSGYNRIELKQLDPNGAGIYLYRRVIDTQTAMTDADYVQVTKLPLRVKDGSKWYTDKAPGMRPVIYRAVAYNRAELKSHEFSSVVLNPSQQVPGVRAKVQQRRLFLSINAKTVNKTIQIELNDIPSGVLAMQVYRRDLSRHETLEESTQVGNTVYMQKLPSPDARYYLTDTVPVDQRIYEYSVLLIFMDGTEFWSTSQVVIQYNPIVNNVIDTSASPIKAVNTGTALDVQFTLSSVIADGKVDQIKKAMEQQGILGFYQTDITDNRDQLQNLIAYQIKRTNITTGEVEEMGVFIGTKFSDKDVGRNLGVKPLQEGHTYEYTINTHFRSAQSLISTFTTTVTNPTNPSRDYSFLPSKWQHPVTLQQGSIVSTTSLKRNHAQSDFTFGTIGDILHLRIALADPKPSVHEATAKTLGKGKVLVQWKLNGSSKKVDHFLVIKEEMGMKTVVGKSHSLTDSNLQFVDTPSPVVTSRSNPAQNPQNVTTVSDELETAATYHVIPVFFDYTHGTSVRSDVVVTRKMR